MPARVAGSHEPAQLDNDTGAQDLQVTPIVVNGAMYLTGGTKVFALEPESGKPIWTSSAPATPMTFMGRDERQYVVVAASGDGILRSEPGTKIVAFALPR